MLARTNFWDAIISLTSISLFFMYLAYGEADLVLMTGGFAVFTIGNAIFGMYKKTTVSWCWTFITGLILALLIVLSVIEIEGIYILSIYIAFCIYEFLALLSMMRPSLVDYRKELGLWRFASLLTMLYGVAASYMIDIPSEEKISGLLFIVFVFGLDYIISMFIERHIEIEMK